MFKIKENIIQDMKDRGSTLSVEIIAGISSFLSLSYIFVVNPSILAQAGMDPSPVLFATIISSGFISVPIERRDTQIKPPINRLRKAPQKYCRFFEFNTSEH